MTKPINQILSFQFLNQFFIIQFLLTILSIYEKLLLYPNLINSSFIFLQFSTFNSTRNVLLMAFPVSKAVFFVLLSKSTSSNIVSPVLQIFFTFDSWLQSLILPYRIMKNLSIGQPTLKIYFFRSTINNLLSLRMQSVMVGLIFPKNIFFSTKQSFISFMFDQLRAFGFRGVFLNIFSRIQRSSFILFEGGPIFCKLSDSSSPNSFYCLDYSLISSFVRGFNLIFLCWMFSDLSNQFQVQQKLSVCRFYCEWLDSGLLQMFCGVDIFL